MAWFRGIRLRLLGLMLIGTAALGSVITVANRTSAELESSIQVLAGQRIPITDTLGDLRTSMNAYYRFSWAAYALSGQAEKRQTYLSEAKQAEENFSKSAQALLALPIAPKTKELVEGSLKEWHGFSEDRAKAHASLVKLSGEGDREAREIMLAKFPSAGLAITLKLREASKITDERNGTFIEEAKKIVIDGQRAMVMIVTLSILALWSLGLFLAISTSRRLVGVSSKVDQAAKEVHGAADSLAGASQQLSSSAEEQASALEETSASLEELTGMVESNLKSAEQSVEETKEIKHISGKANDSMQELVASMKEIELSNEKIEKLAKRIEEIGEKTELIDEIVFQTKLLSFNASVEAERAGEHGRGFAVVAQEVGNLAQMSGKSAVEIASIVKDAIKEARAVAEENRSRVGRGAELCEASATEIRSVQAAAVRIEESSQQILRASKEQSTGLRQIATSVEALNQATQQNAATSEESASASTELSEQARSLGDLVSELFTVVEGSGTKSGEKGSLPSENERVPDRAKRDMANVTSLASRKEKRARQMAQSMPLKKAAGAEASGNDAWESL